MTTPIPRKNRPNIVLLMCDDLGYGDTGFNGNPVIRTPHLDALREQGARFTRFYAGGPVCSPTRGTCLTGRHYLRYGITHANVGCLPAEEITLAGQLRQAGYATGHFGKWHLGTLERDYSGKPGRDPATHYAPPWERDYDVSLATEYAVPTWDPGRDFRGAGERLDEPWASPYYLDGVKVAEPVLGCDSRYIMNHALPFIREAATNRQPFFTTIWFHAPHTPVEAGPDYLAMYDHCHIDEAHYYGVVTAMDEQIGRLTRTLDDLDLAENTIVFFCSDNGPDGGLELSQNSRSRGVTGGLRGRKRSLFNGGIGVPALVRWPGLVEAGSTITAPCSTLDYLPTLLSALQLPIPDDRPLDGIDIAPILSGQRQLRGMPIPYRFMEFREGMFGSPTLALIDDRYKFLTNVSESREEEMLFDLLEDIHEKTNIIARQPQQAEAMRGQLLAFMDSCRASHRGDDYDTDFTPVTKFQEITGGWWHH